jgi:membrane-associated phospholipid phosphatase
MTFLFPHERAQRTRRRLVWCVLWGVAILAAHALDQPALDALRLEDPGSVERKDWYRLLRVLGFWPTWIVVGLCVEIAAGRARELAPIPRPRPGLALILASGLSGLIAEGLKRIITRERPGPDGEYIYRGLFEGFWNDHRLGIPSSHAAVAFGAAFLLARFHRGLAVPTFLLACGCGLTRMLSGAHYLSDVVAAAAIGAFSAAAFATLSRGAPSWSSRPA